MKIKESKAKDKKIKNSDPKNFWTVRGVSFEVRALAKKAAEAENMLIGDYLSKIIQEDAVETIKRSKVREKTETKGDLDKPFDNNEYWKAIMNIQETQNKFAQDIDRKVEMIIQAQNILNQQKEDEQKQKNRSFFSRLFSKV